MVPIVVVVHAGGADRLRALLAKVLYALVLMPLAGDN